MDIKEEEIHNIENNQINEVKINENIINLSKNNNEILLNKNINSSSIIESIFIFNKESNLLLYPKINKENFIKLLDIFNKGKIPKYENKNEMIEFIKEKINLMKQLKKIIENKYEILAIINIFFKKNNFYLFEYLIDLYFESLQALHSDNPIKDIMKKNLLNNELIKDIIDIINWYLCCGFVEKRYYDYVFQKLAALQLSKKLDLYKFCEYLNLLQTFYGEGYDTNYKETLIAKNYVYFYDKQNSGIITNISEDKIKIESIDGISIFLWFYLTNENIEEKDECILVELTINEDIPFKIILDNKIDILVKCKGSLLKNEGDNTFDIPRNKWVQLKIQIMEKQIKLNLFKESKNSLNKDNNISAEIDKNEKIFFYETKIFKDENIPNNNFIIKSINFFKNYLGLAGTIIFCKDPNIKEEVNPPKSPHGLINNKIQEFLKDSHIFGNYFIFSPNLYVNEQNKFIDSTNNITGKINNDKTNEFNGVFKYKNFKNNIYSLGGIENILPLFEIFYKFPNLNKNQKEQDFIYLVFKKMIKILESIFINNRNYLEELNIGNSVHNDTFFQTLQLFLEPISSKYFQKDNDILNSFLNIGKHIYQHFFLKLHKDKTDYFQYILFSNTIAIKFNLEQQALLWKFFDPGKNQELKVNKSDFKKIFMSFHNLHNFCIHLNSKCKHIKNEKPILGNSLTKIIKTILEDKSMKNEEIENLILLLGHKNLNENIVKEIIEILNSYLSLKHNRYIDIIYQNKDLTSIEKNALDEEYKRKKGFVNYILNSDNNYLELLLTLLSCNFRATKKAIIKFFQLLLTNYRDIFDNYFKNDYDDFETEKKDKRISKDNFFEFLKENLYLNNYIEKIENKIGPDITINEYLYNICTEEQIKQQQCNNDKMKRKNSFESQSKIKMIYNDKDEKNDEKNKKRNLSKRNKDIQKVKFNLNKKYVIYDSYFKGDKILFIENDINRLENNIKLNVAISEILVDCLIHYNPPKINSISIDNSNNGVMKKNNQKNKNITISSSYIKNNTLDEERILDLLKTFLIGSKELEVVYNILFLLVSNKLNDNHKLIDIFSHTKSDFLQLIGEILIISYLYTKVENYKKENIFIFIKNNQQKNQLKDEENYFYIIYTSAMDLLMNIFLHINSKEKFKILDCLINIIFKISNNYQKEISANEENKVYITSLKLYEEFLENLSNEFFKQYSSKKNEANKSDEKLSLSKAKNIPLDNNDYYTSIQNYFEYVSYLFEFITLKNYNDIYLNDTHKKYKMNEIAGFPEYFKLKDFGKYYLYYRFAQNCFELFDISKFNANSKKKGNIISSQNNEIYLFEKEFSKKIINDYLLSKDFKDEIQFKINLFLTKNNNNFEKHFYTFVEILTIFNNYYIEKYLTNEDLFELDETNKQNFNFIFFLNFHQFFIINIIIVLSKLKENETNTSINIEFKEIQRILDNCLEYNINNIIKNSNSKTNKYTSHFSNIYVNIFTFLSKLYGKINLNKSCLKDLIEKHLFVLNQNNLNLWLKNSFDDNKNLYETKKNVLFQSLLPREAKDMSDHSTINLFYHRKYSQIYNRRKKEVDNFKLLLKKKEDIFEPIIIMDYQSLKNFIQKRIPSYEHKTTFYESLSKLTKRNNYRKLKKKLYSWNYSYSNLDIFFKNSEKLKFKVSNFLSKDLSRRLLVPILDFNCYAPKFKSFDYKNNLFKSTKNNSEINQYNDLYNIDLKIFKTIPDYYIPKQSNDSFYVEEVCYIKTNHHIHGVIFFPKKDTNHLFFAAKPPEKHEILINNSNYDSENKRCFGSIFSGEFNQKEREIYLDFSFAEINFIFIRKYCFRNNALEIFSKYHRSYYFKFQDYEKRDHFLESFITKANKTNKRKYTFNKIKGFDEYNKSKTIGYYREVEENRPYSSISNITDLWRNYKISNFEYLMWINIYGNRSYQDISQYPIFPWLLINYESKKFETLISKSQNIRDLRLPIGMLYFDQKGKERQESYLESYKLMIMDLNEQNIIKIKMKDEECCEELNSNSISENIIQENDGEKSDSDFNFFSNEGLSNKKKNYNIALTPENIKLNMGDKANAQKVPKFLDYDLNLDKYYYNLNIQYENLPYIFGSHFSNAMYVSHYLCRLFPYSFTSIEIQGSGFDCGDRLFVDFHKTITSVTSEKGDLREIIPDFFTLPELFMNINDLNLGFSQNTEINDVIMPMWCLNNPYFFVEKYRNILECSDLNINSWIDLVFGINQRGKTAQDIGNIFLPFSYDGVIDLRLKPEELLKNREENEYKIRLFEMGVNPTKVFDKKCKRDKNKLYEQIILKTVNPFDEIFHEIKLDSGFKNVLYFNMKNSSSEEIFIMDKSFIEKKLVIQENKDLKSISIKEISAKKEFPFSKDIQGNVEYKLIVKKIFQNEIYIITGLFDGKIYVYPNTNKVEINNHKKEYTIDERYKRFDKSTITSLIIDKNEKYLISGTQKGSLIIFTLNENMYREHDKDFIILLKYFPSHPGYAINYISFNDNLSLVADCSYDGYVNIYSVPKFKLVRSINIDPNTENGLFNLDFVFLSSQPLGAVSVYSNEVGNFKCFSLNGKEIKSQGNDEKLNFVRDENGEEIKLTGMCSPLIFTDYQFNDYLIYILHNKFIFINKFPTMQFLGYIICSNKNIHLTNICFSNNMKYIYAYDEFNKSIYIVQQKNNKNGH